MIWIAVFAGAACGAMAGSAAGVYLVASQPRLLWGRYRVEREKRMRLLVENARLMERIQPIKEKLRILEGRVSVMHRWERTQTDGIRPERMSTLEALLGAILRYRVAVESIHSIDDKEQHEHSRR